MASPIFTGLTILMLGDSHFAAQGYLVTTLQDALIRQGAQVTTYAACGAPAGVWAEGGVAPCGSAQRTQSGPVKYDHSAHATVPTLSDMVKQLHPNLIVVGAGDTMAGYAQATMPTAFIERQVSALTSQISSFGIPCVWVGPGWGTEGGPYFKTYARAQQVSAFLSTHVAPCRYIDSQTFSKPGEWPTFDGQHYTYPGYQKWAEALDAAMVRLAQTPP